MKKTFIYIFLLSIFTTISFAQWVEQTSGIGTNIYSVSAVDDNVAWICSAGGVVRKTTNGGTTWAATTTNPTTALLYNIFAFDANLALTTSSPGGTTGTNVYRTTNGGTSWTLVFNQPTAAAFIDAIWMTSATNGFMMGDPVGARWSLWRTTNGGVNWDSTGLYLAQNAGEAGWNNGMFVSGNYIWFNTSATRIYYSSNNGASWTAQTIASQAFGTIWFNTLTNGMASSGTALSYTVNSGGTWTPVTLPGTGTINGITGTGSNWWVVRATTSIYRSTNNGTSWTTEYTAPAGNHTHIMKAINGNRLWAVRINGGIAKSDGLIGIIPIGGETPTSFALSQNYPNPFNPTTDIKFSIPKTGLVKIAVYDAMGREAAVLVNESLSAGSYSVDFNASNLSSGIYFYTMFSGNFKETKKMILVK